MISNRFFYMFGDTGKFVGWILLLTGIIIVIMGHYAGLILVLLGSLVGFTISGINIDEKNKKYKLFVSYLGFLKTGVWKDLSQYNELLVLPKTLKASVYSRSNRKTETTTKGYMIYAIKRGHQFRIPLYFNKSLNKIKEKAIDYSIKMNMIYNP